ncbi:hypothetical protein [Marinomonas sp. IMCC 4694]|uniref:hypothetical protein n=1 Tax=Marinomonas sp. IMCC 4694 TaxID=2605432 RepID=UPI0011E8A056|nr:hypothetical protein [Marinomonas sp. IMCC 4694]TYL47321.1 hypothetical protein FXV75_04765 [Marinomonas sp. IMCC 4694]
MVKSFSELRESVGNAIQDVEPVYEKTEKFLDIVDTKINKIAKDIREEMAEEREAIHKSQIKYLCINILILITSVGTLFINKFINFIF